MATVHCLPIFLHCDNTVHFDHRNFKLLLAGVQHEPGVVYRSGPKYCEEVSEGYELHNYVYTIYVGIFESV